MYCPNRECPDFLEDGTPGEYVDTVTTCPKCGATLVAEFSAEEAYAGPPAAAPATLDDGPCPVEVVPRGPLVALAAFDYLDETEPFVAALEAAGIAVFQFIDDGRDFQDRGGIATCTRLLVPESQASRALAVVHAVEHGV